MYEISCHALVSENSSKSDDIEVDDIRKVKMLV